MIRAKITKLRLNLSKLCLEILWLLFSGHGIHTHAYLQLTK